MLFKHPQLLSCPTHTQVKTEAVQIEPIHQIGCNLFNLLIQIFNGLVIPCRKKAAYTVQST